MVEAAINKFGKIDVLVNNANIDFPVKPFVDLSREEVNAKITSEMQALYNCSQAVLRVMTQRKSEKLIFISSSLSRQPGYGFAAHAAAKSAVGSMAKVMATELGPEGITVNVIGPGLAKTDATAGQPAEMHEQIAAFTPLRRVGMPDDIAGVALFLTSSLSDGQYIPVNGGSFPWEKKPNVAYIGVLIISTRLSDAWKESARLTKRIFACENSTYFSQYGTV